MKRVGLAMFVATAALAAAPSSASATFFARWCAPYGGWYAPAPHYQVVPQFYLVPVPQYYFVPGPEYHVPLNPRPRTENNTIPPARPTGSPRSDAPPRSAPMVTVIPDMLPPKVAPAADPMVKPAGIDAAIPMPAPAPMNPLVIPDPMVPKAPPINPLVLPEGPKAPPAVVPEAKPMPAPAAPEGIPAIPLPEPRKTPTVEKNNKDELPPLVLPPEGTGTSSGVIPPITVKSSPLAGAIKVQVFTAAGTATGALRKVGFFNHTDRDLELTIAGQAVKLPKKSYLNAELPAKFTWKAAGNDAQTATVPDGAAGLDVVFKE